MNVTELRILAEERYKSGQLYAALDAYASLCELIPDDVQAWHMRAAICGMLGQYQKAVDHTDKAISLSPDSPNIYTNRANALIELSRYDEALAALTTATRLRPADSSTHLMLGKLYLLMGEHTKAETAARFAHKTAPEDAEATNLLARICLDTNKIDESIALCEQTISCIPGHTNILLTLIEGYILAGNTRKCREIIVNAPSHTSTLAQQIISLIRRIHTDGNHTVVIPALQMLTEIFPDEHRYILMLADSQIKTGNNADAILTINNYPHCASSIYFQKLLADAYKNVNDNNNAISCLLNAAALEPDKAEPVMLLSHLYQSNGEPKYALQILDSFSQRHPENHQILIDAGKIHSRSGHFSRAVDYFKRAINSRPDSAVAHKCLGMAYLNNRMEEEAQSSFETAIKYDPEMVSAYCSMAYLYHLNGNHDEAESYYDKAIMLDPEYETAISGKAAIYERRGNTDKVLELIKPYIESHTENISTLLVYARVSQSIGKGKEAIELLRDALNNVFLTKNERMQCYFSIGKLLDRLNSYDEAFINYERGNQMNTLKFSRDSQVRFTDSTISSFSASNMKRITRSSIQNSQVLVFIVGMPRSGTTLTEQILSSHPDVYGAGELPLIMDIAAEIPAALGSTQPYPLGIDKISREILDRFSCKYMQAMKSLTHGNKVIINKLPANFMFLGLIELLFPNARILHCVRDPMDTCLSCYFQHFSRGLQFSFDQMDLALYYQQYRRLMEHWASSLTVPVKEINYETLISDTEGLTRNMLNFIGLDWHPACSEFHNSKRKVLTASYDQVRQPIYNRSVGRWKHYRKHLSPLHGELSKFY